MFSEKRFLIFGAHPDDADLIFGGTALKLIAAGHKVKFISMANGDAGHFSMAPRELAKRRYEETQASAKIAGLEEYKVLNNPDCCLEASLENRKETVRIIREFNPDVVISHRINDYHPDHRAAAQLVQDASFLVMVPLFCPETPIPENWPIFGCSWDHFQCPSFTADVVVEIDSVIDDKLKLMDCHKSQFYEWLPWNKGYKDFDYNKLSKAEIRTWLTENWLCRNLQQAELYRDKIKEFYGDAADQVKHVESFEITEYGRIPSKEEIRELFPV
jgi:N-acetylglucosamine malate deacetylase 1